MKSHINIEVTRRIKLLNKYKDKYLKHIKELKELNLISSKYRINQIIKKISNYVFSFEDVTIMLFKSILLDDLRHTDIWYKKTMDEFTLLYNNNIKMVNQLYNDLREYLKTLHSLEAKKYTDVYESAISIPVNIKRQSVTRSSIR